MLFDGDGNRMTPTHASNKGTRYRYYVSRPLITKDHTEQSAGPRVPAGEIEQVVTSRMRQWLIDARSIYQATQLSDPSMQRRLIARAAEIGKTWPELPEARQRAFLTALIERIDIADNQIDIHIRPTRLAALLNLATFGPAPVRFASDSPLEGDGFELSVPRHRDGGFRSQAGEFEAG
jgi:hypothetical protein